MCCFAIWEEYCTYSYCKITNTVVYMQPIILYLKLLKLSTIPSEIDMPLWFVSALTCYNVYTRITGYVLHIILYTVHCTVYKEKCPVFLRIGRARAGFKAKNRCAVYTPWSRSLRWADTLLDNLTCYCFALFDEIVHHFPLFD